MNCITSYYIRIKRDRDQHPDYVPGTVRLLVQLQLPVPMGISPNMAICGQKQQRNHFTHMAGRKDGQVSVSGQR